ncbi:DUF1036 domain-containing protein [Oceanicaulis alexandrii]|uniref:DUF1036 domain-containing protein n=1 Tax=Oceanicaulis alexandrii TaxID=153233 RepID=UPI0003B60537|nr:DUF1036 domain-containing protein [Oceanicaulis alexandrii]
MLNRIMLALVLMLGFGGAAQAGQVCNETSFMVEAAKAWRTPSGLAVEGWARIAPGGCAEIGPATDTEQYLYARTTRAYLGGVREWRGSLDICVDEADFAFEGVADCETLGLETRKFRQLTDAERDSAVLVEVADFGDRAEEAGLQRLLQSAGYDINVIDGYAGRRTRRQVAAFEADIGRSFGADRSDLIQALHERALERNTSLGLQVCNDANLPVGVAVARAVGDGFETRGWWRIAPGGCAQTLSAQLTGDETYVYAQLIDGDALRPLASGTEAFCITPARFTSQTRGECEASGFQPALFRAAPAAENGGSMMRLDLDDFEEPLP